MQHEVEGKHVRHLEALNLAVYDAGEMLAHALRRHLARQQVIGCAIRSKERDIGFISLIAGTGVGQAQQLRFHDPASSTLTRTYSSISSRGASVGQMPSRPRGSSMPPAPPMKG